MSTHPENAKGRLWGQPHPCAGGLQVRGASPDPQKRTSGLPTGWNTLRTRGRSNVSISKEEFLQKLNGGGEGEALSGAME
jgi:hypothetical protein